MKPVIFGALILAIVVGIAMSALITGQPIWPLDAGPKIPAATPRSSAVPSSAVANALPTQVETASDTQIARAAQANPSPTQVETATDTQIAKVTQANPSPTVTVAPPAATLPTATVILPTPTESSRVLAAAATPAQVPTVNLSAPTLPPVLHVGNTGGVGTYLRHSALQSDHWIWLADNTDIKYLGSRAERDNDTWAWVSDSHGDVGWIQTRYVVA